MLFVNSLTLDDNLLRDHLCTLENWSNMEPWGTPALTSAKEKNPRYVLLFAFYFLKSR